MSGSKKRKRDASPEAHFVFTRAVSGKVGPLLGMYSLSLNIQYYLLLFSELSCTSGAVFHTLQMLFTEAIKIFRQRC